MPDETTTQAGSATPTPAAYPSSTTPADPSLGSLWNLITGWVTPATPTASPSNAILNPPIMTHAHGARQTLPASVNVIVVRRHSPPPRGSPNVTRAPCPTVQSREHIEEIARQLGISEPEKYKNEQTKLVMEVQNKLGFPEKERDGIWGSKTYEAYMKWAADNKIAPVVIARPMSLGKVNAALFAYLNKYGVPGKWPSRGVMVAIAYYESRDTKGKGGPGVDVEFNECASPFARMKSRPTAVGILQINEATAKDLATRAKKEMMELLEVTDPARLEAEALKARYDGEKNIGMAIILMRLDILKEGLTVEESLNRRWETYSKDPARIERIGEKLERAGLLEPGKEAPFLEILRNPGQ